MNDVIAFLAMEEVHRADIGARIGDDVVARAAVDMVHAVAAFQAVVTGPAPDRVVALAGDDVIVAVGALNDDVLDAVVAQVLGNAVAVSIAALDQWRQGLEIGIVLDGIALARHGQLPCRVEIEDPVGTREEIAGDRRSRFAKVGRAQGHLGKRVAFEFGEQVEPLDAREIVEAVAVLQVFHLQLEDEGEGGAEHAAEIHLLLGKAAHPQVDVGKAAEPIGIGARAGKEGRAVAGRRDRPVRPEAFVPERLGRAEHDRHRRGALAFHRGLVCDRRMRAVGGDEVDDGGRVLEVEREVGPVCIRSQLAVAVRHCLELGARLVQGRHAGVAAARDVDRRKVERDAEQLVAQGVRDELVDLVADLCTHPADDRSGRLGMGQAPALVIGDGIEEGLEQRHVVRRAVGGDPVDILVEHRMAEAIDHVGELGEDRRVDVGIRLEQEGVDIRLHLAGEFLEDKMLVFHLGDEAGCLEEAFAIPDEILEIGRNGGDIDQQPLVEERDIAIRRRLERDLLGLLDHAVVFAMEDVMDGRQADILVPAPIAGDEMRIQELVVILDVLPPGVGCDRVACHVIGIGGEDAGGEDRNGRVRDVIEERMARAEGADGARIDRVGRVAFEKHVVGGPEEAVRAEPGHQLGIAVGPGDEVAVLVRRDQRDIGDIRIGEPDAKYVFGMCLDIRPCRQAMPASFEQAARRNGGSVGSVLILAHEDLLGGMRAVGLILVHPRRRRVACASAGGRAGQDHEVGVRAGGVVERIIRRERNIDHAVAALGDEIEAMVEELAEQGEQGAEGCGVADIGRHVGQEDRRAVHLDAVLNEKRVELCLGQRIGLGIRRQCLDDGVGRANGLQGIDLRLSDNASIFERRDDGRRIVERLVDDEVGDQTRLRIGDVAGLRVVVVGCVGEGARALGELGIGQRQELLVGRAPVLPAGHKVVVAAVDGPQAVGKQVDLRGGGRIGINASGLCHERIEILAGSMPFGYLDLLQDVLQVVLDDIDHDHSPPGAFPDAFRVASRALR